VTNTPSLVIADYGPYRTGQAPGTANIPTDAQIDQDLAIIQTDANTVRIYSMLDDGVYIAQTAESMGLMVIPSAYLPNPYGTVDPRYPFSDLIQNRDVKAELDALVAYLNDPTTDLSKIPMVVVGSEAISQLGAWDDYAVIDAINYVKANAPNAVAAGVKFTTAETAGGQYYIDNPSSGNQTRLGQAVDVIYCNIFPFWEGISIDQAVAQVVLEYQQLQQTYPGKQIVISETGWPSSGQNYGAAVASTANEQEFWTQFTAAAQQYGIQYSMFEQFDEPYKETLKALPNPEAHWGLFDVNRVAKVFLTDLSIAPANAIQHEGQSGVTPLTFTVTRTGDAAGIQTVDWSVSGSGTHPASPADFDAGANFPTGTLTFASGQTSQTVTVNVVGDTAVEPDEGFTVTIANPTDGVTIDVASADGVILNSVPPDQNFTGGNTSDILFHDTNSGDVGYWSVNAGVQSGAVSLGSPGPSWSVVGTGDFNGDHTTDILFQSTGGDIGTWLMQNGKVESATSLGSPGPNWSIIGTGDLYGDGTDDIVFRATDGTLADWRIQNGQDTNASVINQVPANWISAGVGDLTGDGTADLLFISTSGTVADWVINNGTEVSANPLGDVGSQWSILGLADLNGDGQKDILFQSQDGDLGAWLMQNGSVSAVESLGSPGPGWQVAGLGDYNGDGTTDILFRGTDGTMAAWLMQNGVHTQTVITGSIPSAWLNVPSHPGITLPS
jgi:exo-beta-1,3-glucanase (GH17 family)